MTSSADARPPAMEELIRCLSNGDQANAVAQAKELSTEGVGREAIVLEGVEEAMRRMDDKCTSENFNLLEIMLCGRAVLAVFRELYPPGTDRPPTRGTVVVATLKGDVHDLGKNVLKMVLTARGYRVVDCGKNCGVDELITTAIAEQAQVIGISGLITSVTPLVQTVRERLRERGASHITVIAGGAALKQAAPDFLNVDYVAETAFDGVSHVLSVHPGCEP